MNTLELDRTFLRSQEDVFREFPESARRLLAERGVLSASQPVDRNGQALRPNMPNDLSALPPDLTLQQLGRFAAWLSYLRVEVVNLHVKAKGLTKAKKHLTAQIRSQLKGSAQAKADALLLDPRYIELDQDEFRADTEYELAKAILEGDEGAFFALSRTITSHGQEIDRSKREHNARGNRGTGAQRPNQHR